MTPVVGDVFSPCFRGFPSSNLDVALTGLLNDLYVRPMTSTTFTRIAWRGLGLLLATLFVAVVPLGGAQAASSDGGTLRIGSDLTYPPYAYMKDGTPTGFDPDFMRAMAKELNMQPEFVDTRFEQLITSLKVGPLRRRRICPVHHPGPGKTGRLHPVLHHGQFDRHAVLSGTGR